MAIQIISDYRYINPVGNPYWIIASSSNANQKYNFRYNYDIILSGVTASTKKVLPNPYNQLPEILPLKGESDVNTVIRDKFDSYLPPISTQSGLTFSNDNFIQTEVKCIEVYSPSLNVVPQVTTASETTGGFFSINAYLSQDDYYGLMNDEFGLRITDNQTVQLFSRLLTNRSSTSQLANYNIISFVCNGDTPYTAQISDNSYLSGNFSNVDDPGGEGLGWDIFNTYAQLAIPEVLKGFTSDILIIDDWNIPGNHIKWRTNTTFTDLRLIVFMDITGYDFSSGWLKFLGYANGTWSILANSISATEPNNPYEYEVQFDGVPLQLTENYTKFGIRLVEADSDGPIKFFVYKRNTENRFLGEFLQATTEENLFVIRGYKNGQLTYVDSYLTYYGDDMRRIIMTDYYKNQDVDYYDINITPNTIIPTIPFSLTNNLRLKNDCNSINNFEEVTLIWMNSYGEWDSYTFMKLQEQFTTQKSGIRKEFNTRLATIQTQNYSQMNRNNILSFNVITKNLSLIEYDYLYNILLSKEVYWLNDGELYSIVVLTNDIESKAMNNIYKQLSLNVRLSQKLTNY